jgi:hypothetical protein
VAFVLAEDGAVRADQRSVLDADDLQRFLVDQADLLLVEGVLGDDGF